MGYYNVPDPFGGWSYGGEDLSSYMSDFSGDPTGVGKETQVMPFMAMGAQQLMKNFNPAWMFTSQVEASRAGEAAANKAAQEAAARTGGHAMLPQIQSELAYRRGQSASAASRAVQQEGMRRADVANQMITQGAVQESQQRRREYMVQEEINRQRRHAKRKRWMNYLGSYLMLKNLIPGMMGGSGGGGGTSDALQSSISMIPGAAPGQAGAAYQLGNPSGRAGMGMPGVSGSVNQIAQYLMSTVDPTTGEPVPPATAYESAFKIKPFQQQMGQQNTYQNMLGLQMLGGPQIDFMQLMGGMLPPVSPMGGGVVPGYTSQYGNQAQGGGYGGP